MYTSGTKLYIQLVTNKSEPVSQKQKGILWTTCEKKWKRYNRHQKLYGLLMQQYNFSNTKGEKNEAKKEGPRNCHKRRLVFISQPRQTRPQEQKTHNLTTPKQPFGGGDLEFLNQKICTWTFQNNLELWNSFATEKINRCF